MPFSGNIGFAAVGASRVGFMAVGDKKIWPDAPAAPMYTGKATRVGTETYSGIQDLAWDGSNLYSIQWNVGRTNLELHTIDRTTGVATRVGSAVSFGIDAVGSLRLAWDGTAMFLVDRRVLYTLNLTTGVATRIASLSINRFQADGLAWDGANMFVVDGRDDILYTVDRTRAILSRIGAVGAGETTPIGLCWDGFNLLMIGQGRGAGYLYTLDRTTGLATEVDGSSDFGLEARQYPRGLEWDGSNLYVGEARGLYTLDQS